MALFSTTPYFGSTTNPQNYGSPKQFSVYQPMPAVGTPSFGGLGRPSTPKETSRHSSYSTKDIEPTIQPILPSVERSRRHREYYFEGGDIYFLVENYLFRVHRYFFERESPIFRKQFADSVVNGHHRLGTSDSDPLVLHDVKTDDFSRFLWVFYNPIYSIYDATTEDWAAILGLAHHWQFGEVKSLVVRELEKQIIPSIYKIVIYHRYDVDRGLLLPSYTDLVSREETLNMDEAKDLGLETSLMIMTAREIVRKGDAPTSAVRVSVEDLKNIIRQIFRFPLPRPESPLSDVTAAEPTLDPRSPLTSERTDLRTVSENKNEHINLTASASLNSSQQPVTVSQATAPIISAPIPPAPVPSTPSKRDSSKPGPVTPRRATTASTEKEESNPKQGPSIPNPLFKPEEKSKPDFTNPTISQKLEEPKPGVKEQVQPTTENGSKPEAQDNKKKPFASRLAEAGKGTGTTTVKDATTPKEKDGDKPAENKDAKDKTNTKDTNGQDSNETPVGTPLLNQDQDQSGTPTTGQSALAKESKTFLARGGKARKTSKQMQTSKDSNKGKTREMHQENLQVPSTREPPTRSGVEPREPVPKTKELGAEMGVNGGEKKVVGDGKSEGEPVEAVDVNILEGGVKTDRPGDEKKDDGKDGKKSEGGTNDPPEAVVSPIVTDDTTKSATDIKLISHNATETTSDKDDPTKNANSDIKEGTGPTIYGKTMKPELKEPAVVDEGEVATPKRVTKELPVSPGKPLQEKPVPALGLTVPESPENPSAPSSTTTVTDSTLSPLQQVLEDAEDETLMERMARLKVGDGSYQQPKDIAPPAHTDLESDFEGATAPTSPSTPTSRAGKGSFNLLLRSEVPLSDDDDFFLDCDSNASVSNFDGL